MAVAVESRLVVSLVPGRRTEGQTRALVKDFAQRAKGGKPPCLITSDVYKPYQTALLATYGEGVVPPRTGRPGRPRKAYLVPPEDLVYAVVHKIRRKGRVVDTRLYRVFGSEAALTAALVASPVSRTINTALVERMNGTDRQLNARKARKTYQFSKVLDMHVAQSWLSVIDYHFCWDRRGLRLRQTNGTFQHRSPAIAAGLTKRIWSIDDLAHYQVVRWSHINAKGKVTR